MATITDDRQLLLQIVREAYDQETWNGTNLKAALADAPVEVATWTPPDAKHSVADLAIHCAYWKHRTRLGLAPEAEARFPYPGEDWVDAPAPRYAEDWAGVLAFLDREHAGLCDAIENLPEPVDFAEPRSREQVRKLFGLAIHDAYHTGQVNLIKAMYARAHA
jgi:hypothetical protein